MGFASLFVCRPPKGKAKPDNNDIFIPTDFYYFMEAALLRLVSNNLIPRNCSGEPLFIKIRAKFNNAKNHRKKPITSTAATTVSPPETAVETAQPQAAAPAASTDTADQSLPPVNYQGKGKGKGKGKSNGKFNC